MLKFPPAFFCYVMLFFLFGIGQIWEIIYIVLDEFLDHLKKELSSVEEENKKVEEECEELSRRYVEGWETKIWFGVIIHFVILFSIVVPSVSYFLFMYLMCCRFF